MEFYSTAHISTQGGNMDYPQIRYEAIKKLVESRRIDP